MKDIIINEKNMDSIRALLEDVQKRSIVRNISTETIFAVVDDIERRFFRQMKCLKKNFEGTEILVNVHAQSFPNAYRGIPESTIFRLKFLKGKWRLTSLLRGRCNNHRYLYLFSESAKTDILDSFNR